MNLQAGTVHLESFRNIYNILRGSLLKLTGRHDGVCDADGHVITGKLLEMSFNFLFLAYRRRRACRSDVGAGVGEQRQNCEVWLQLTPCYIYIHVAPICILSASPGRELDKKSPDQIYGQNTHGKTSRLLAVHPDAPACLHWGSIRKEIQPSLGR